MPAGFRASIGKAASSATESLINLRVAALIPQAQSFTICLTRPDRLPTFVARVVELRVFTAARTPGHGTIKGLGD